jgi:glucose/arabinose dehydrogenase
MKTRITIAIAIALTLVLSTTACEAPSSLTVTTVIGGLNRPWDIAFTPDGTMLFTEKSGQINALIGNLKVTMATPADVVVAGEGGMLGMAVDPEFATNRRIYTCFLSSTPAPTRDIRVVRWEVGSDYTSLSARADIITGISYSNGRHSGCRPRFGPDGNLYVGTGDAAVGTNPQNPQSLGGKVLRVDTDGNGVAGNPGVDDPLSGFLPQIFTYGHRNVQGIAFHPRTGAAYSIEHGTACDDEVNRLVAGGNYGWDPVPGYDETTPMTDLVKFPDAVEAVWSSGCPTIAPSGGTFLAGPQWSGWNQHLAVAVLKGTELRTFLLNNDSDTVFREDVTVTDQGRLRTAVLGPDGNLYLSQDANPGSILRVVPTP